MTRELIEIMIIGGDKARLIANVTTLLFEHGISVEDLGQVVCEEILRMTLRIDTTEMTYSRDEPRAALPDLGDDLSVDVQVRFPLDRETRETVVLVTKGSHCLEALFEAWTSDDLGAEVSVVIGNHDTLEPLTSRCGVPFHDISDEKGAANEERLLDLLERYDVDLVVLARYTHVLDPNVASRYEDRIINIHPSLLSAFPGATAYRQTREEDVHIAGVTTHYVATDLDQDPIITQRVLDVPGDASTDEIEERGQPLKVDALLEAVKLHLNSDVSIHRGRTNLHEDADPERYQLGLTHEAQASNPDRPVDGVIDALGECEALAPKPSED